MFPTPSSIPEFLVHVLITIPIGVVALSFAEHAIHRHVMHRKRFPAWVYRALPDLKAQFHNHAVMHHGTYYKRFDHEPSDEGKYFNLRILVPDTVRILIAFSPILLALAMFVSTVSAVVILVMVIGHNLTWNAVHMQMHIPERKAWFRNTATYRFLARHHFMHHQRTGRNYNVVLPIADFILGSATKPRISDVREMLRLGYVKPRKRGHARSDQPLPSVIEPSASVAPSK